MEVLQHIILYYIIFILLVIHIHYIILDNPSRGVLGGLLAVGVHGGDHGGLAVAAEGVAEDRRHHRVAVRDVHPARGA